MTPLLAYVVPAALTWLLLGTILNVMSVAVAAWIALTLYSLFYGFAEVADVAELGIPGSRWQVPQAFVMNKGSGRILATWGGLLGPGFATRNPYAGFVALVLGIATFGSVTIGACVALAVGAAHGASRALALLRDARTIEHRDYLESVLRSMYWRRVDGVVLLVLAGLSVVAYSAHVWSI